VEQDVIRSPGSPLDQVRSGPPDIAGLFRERHLELVRLALLVVGDLSTAEDVVQDAFEQLHKRWHLLRRQSSALDYVRSTVLNRSRSVLRRRGVARRYAPRIATPAAVDAGSAVELRSEFLDAFRALPRRQREVLALRYYLDLSVADTAGILRISEGAVRSTSSRGLAALARILEVPEGGRSS
jgi:RNA polymerase sigma-70 factor (sigma-E family)